MNNQLRESIEQMVGEITQVVALQEQGCTSEVQQIRSERGAFLLKSSYQEKYREWLRDEARVLKKLSSSDRFPVPKYFGFFEDEEGSHLLMSYENGISLTSALKNSENLLEKTSLIRSFGRFLQRLHEMEICETRQNDWLDEQLTKAEENLKNWQVDGNLELLEKLKANRPMPVEQRIIHGDCTTDNVLVVAGEVRLFIDVAGLTIGDPRYDESLAIRKFLKNEGFLNAFYEGYTRYRVSMEEFEYFEEGLYEFF
jgi:aminoglycoside phosphotransferase (APT) family kinase protein